MRIAAHDNSPVSEPTILARLVLANGDRPILGILQRALPASVAGVVFRSSAVLGFAAVFAYRWRTPCQRCRRPLKWSALLWKPWNPPAALRASPRCRYCGTSIDRDIGATES